MGTKTSHAENFIRPAAPLATIATVIAANRMNHAA